MKVDYMVEGEYLLIYLKGNVLDVIIRIDCQCGDEMLYVSGFDDTVTCPNKKCNKVYKIDYTVTINEVTK